MKETQTHLKDQTAEVYQKPVEKKLIRLGSIIPKRGHTLFKINVETMEVSKADFNEVAVSFDGAIKRKVVIEPGFDYVSALNAKNALRIHKRKLI